MNYNLSYATFSDKGGREVNEDSLGSTQKEDNMCFVLCDGLGGHGMGEIASSVVVEVFKNQFFKTTEMTNFLGQTFCAAQDILLAEQNARKSCKKMKTTATVVATDDEKAYIGHIGDSRVYVFKNNRVKLRTYDHSIPQMLVLTREIKESEIRNHPDRNILLRVMGVEWEENQYELMSPIPLKKCQAFLLCSDGFWELINETEMCNLLKKASSVQQWILNMVDVVKKNGIGRNMDNYSAIGIWCQKKR